MGSASGPLWRRGREAALRILYFWEVGQVEPNQAIASYFREHASDAPPEVVEFARTLVLGTIEAIDDVDALIERHARNWRLDRLAVIDRLVLRLAAWELTRRGDTAPAVILNEAIELARRFSSDQSVGFVNGVLDGILKAQQSGEPPQPPSS
jgi:N utilization substance protein B